MNVAVPARNFLHPGSRLAHAAGRGALLAHLIGACFFITMLIARTLPQQILSTRILDWPIRMVGIWLLIDRFGRSKRTKISPWDWTHLAFVALYGFALVYAELFMIRDTGLMNYIQWINETLNGYIYFL